MSHNHPIGMVIFSEKSKVVFPLNQTDACSSLHALSKDMIENRANRINQDREGVVGKTTNLISAALTSVDVVRTSKIQRVIIGKIYFLLIIYNIFLFYIFIVFYIFLIYINFIIYNIFLFHLSY